FYAHCKEKSDFIGDDSKWSHIVITYFTDNYWNALDLPVILLYLVAFIIRFSDNATEQIFIASKICLAIDLFLWYMRMLHLCAAYGGSLGTRLSMIFLTMRDLSFFVCFILIFILGYSVSTYSLITTGDQVTWYSNKDGGPYGNYSYTLSDGAGTWNWNLLRNVFAWGVWRVFGDTDLIGVEQADNTTLAGGLLRFLV
ncbi:unnamed protein product, partial [Didymodactylos carnosus]